MRLPSLATSLDIVKLLGQRLKGFVKFTRGCFVKITKHMFHLLSRRLNFPYLPFRVRQFLSQPLQVGLIACSGSLSDSRFKVKRILSKLCQSLLSLLSIDKQLDGCFRS